MMGQYNQNDFQKISKIRRFSTSLYEYTFKKIYKTQLKDNGGFNIPTCWHIYLF